MMKKTLLLITVCTSMMLAATASVSAQTPDEAYKTMVEKMLALSGSKANTKAAIKQMTDIMKQQSSNIPEEFWSMIQEKFEAKFNNRITDLYIPIYQKYLTLDNLKGIIAFYESPTGKKLAESTPAITTEAMQMGSRLGQEIAADILQEMEALKDNTNPGSSDVPPSPAQ